MTILTKLERKIGWLAIGNLPLYIVTTQAIVYIWGMVNPENLNLLVLNPYLVLQRFEFWRLLTFLFITPLQNPLFAFFYLYLLYIYGTALEAEWGSFSFTIFYLLGGLGTIVAAFLSSLFFIPVLHTAFYLNLSIFLAFAVLHPDFVIHLFFILPVKIKWLGWLTWIWLGYSLLVSPVPIKLIILVSLGNYFLFFAKHHMENMQEAIRLYKHRQRFKNWGNDE